MRTRILVVLGILVLCGFRCSFPWEGKGAEEITIVTYNAHNLFDDVDDGREYPEFRMGSPTWNAGLYAKRLENTAFALRSPFPDAETWPDIICLVEIEGAKVLEDLADGPLRRGGYRWIAAGGPADSPIKCGVLSRREIAGVRAHALADYRGFGTGRDMLEVSVDLDGTTSLTIFVCHWKSRIEGEKETEETRRGASMLAAGRIRELLHADPDRLIVVCGDFNESPDEFDRVGGKYPTAFMPVRAGTAGCPDAWNLGVINVAETPGDSAWSGKEVNLFCPWENVGGYSYIFRGKKERLDGFFMSGALVDGAGLDYSSFLVGMDPALVDDKGVPLPWNGASGYSDHLPLGLRIGSTLYRSASFMEQ